MKTTAGYLIALILGLLVGWLAQQFWLSKQGLAPSQTSSHAISRQQQRLINLQQQALIESDLSVVAPLESLSIGFSNAIRQKNLDLALERFSQLEEPSLEKVLLIAELAYELGDYELLFSTLYEFRYGLDFKSEQRLLAEIDVLVEKVDKALGENRQYDELVNIYRLLISLGADNTLFYLRLSYWQLQAGKPFAASQSLIGARNDIQIEAEVNKLQTAIDLYEEYGAHIDVPLRVVGEHYLVPVTLDNNDTLELMLDTGASKTVIKRGIIENSQPAVMEDISELLMNTANGQATGYRANIPNVSIGNLNLRSLDVVLMELPNFEYDGLLGMNVLNQFDFNLDQDKAVLKLLPKKPSLSVSP